MWNGSQHKSTFASIPTSKQPTVGTINTTNTTTAANTIIVSNDPNEDNKSNNNDGNTTTITTTASTATTNKSSSGPVDSKKVLQAAKDALDFIESCSNETVAQILSFKMKEQQQQRSIVLQSQLPSHAIYNHHHRTADHIRCAQAFERTESGNIIQMYLGNDDDDSLVASQSNTIDDHDTKEGNFSSSLGTTSNTNHHDTFMSQEKLMDSKSRARIMKCVQRFSHTLQELKNTTFQQAELWELYQYYFSPAQKSVPCDLGQVKAYSKDCTNRHPSFPGDNKGTSSSNSSRSLSSSLPIKELNKTNKMSRKLSFRYINDAVATMKTSSSISEIGTKRRTSSSNHSHDNYGSGGGGCGDATNENDQEIEEPSFKRAKCTKSRIDFYPRIKYKIDNLRLESLNDEEILGLLRQLKFMEQVVGTRLTHESSLFENAMGEDEMILTSDLETILLDLA